MIRLKVDDVDAALLNVIAKETNGSMPQGITKQIEGQSISTLADAAARPIRYFRPEIEQRIGKRRHAAPEFAMVAE